VDEYAFAYSSFEGSPTNVIYGNFAVDYYGGTFSYSFDLINWVTSGTPSYGQDARFTGMAFDPEQGSAV